VRLLHPVAQGVDFLRGDADGSGDPEGISIEDEFEIDLAGIVDVVDDDCHYVLQLEGDVADAVADAHVGDLFDLTGHLFEEEMPLLPRHLGQGVAVAIDLAVYGRGCFFA
jgi:hypothetical protein